MGLNFGVTLVETHCIVNSKINRRLTLARSLHHWAYEYSEIELKL